MGIKKSTKNIVIFRWNKIHKEEKNSFKLLPEFFFLKARVCGYLAGDGTVMIRKEKTGKKHYYIKFYPDHISLINPFIESFQTIYNKKPKVKKLNKFFEVACYSKPVVEDLLKTSKFGLLKWRAHIRF